MNIHICRDEDLHTGPCRPGTVQLNSKRMKRAASDGDNGQGIGASLAF